MWLVLVRKAKKKLFPFSVIITTDRKNIKTIKFNPWILKTSVALGAVCLCVFIFLLFSFVNLQFKLKENAQLTYENEIQAEKLATIKEDLATLNDKLVYMDNTKENITEMINDSPVNITIQTASRSNYDSNKIQMFSANSNSEADIIENTSSQYPSIDTTKKGLTALREIENLVSLLQEETDSAKLSIEDLQDSITERLDFLVSKPTFWPLEGRITSVPGERPNPFTGRGTEHHDGLDIAAPYGTYVRAAGSGVVTFAGWDSVYGRLLVIDHGYGYKSMYGHNSSLTVKVGQ